MAPLPAAGGAAPADTAICFVLAAPEPETRSAALDRTIRRELSRIPLLGRAIPPRWSPSRRAGYGAGLHACVKSLRRRHRNLPPIVVLNPSGGTVLADVDAVVPFDVTPYQNITPINAYLGVEVYYKLELFRFNNYKRIVYLDCDTIVLEDISALWDPDQFNDRGLYAVVETAEMGVHPMMIGKFNSGVMLINRPLLHESVHERMLAIARASQSYDFSDQGVINRYFMDIGETPGELDAGYNVLVVAKTRGQWQTFRNRVRILHFTNKIKPWSLGHDLDIYFDQELKNVWDREYGALEPYR